jgi:hypothetical protein
MQNGLGMRNGFIFHIKPDHRNSSVNVGELLLSRSPSQKLPSSSVRATQYIIGAQKVCMAIANADNTSQQLSVPTGRQLVTIPSS